MTDPTAYTFSVQVNQGAVVNYSKSDLLLARTENVAKSSTGVQLTFSHALSLVQVEAKREVNMPLFDENDFTVTLTGALTNAALSWSGNLTGTGTATNIVMHRVADASGYVYRALIPAHTLPADSKVTFVQTTTGKEIDMEYLGVASKALTASKAHKYSVTLGWGIDPEHTYTIGDAYPYDGPAVGIVYQVSDGGRHGKVVGLTEIEDIKWADSYGITQARDTLRGIFNMRKVKEIDADFTGYPVFQWVHSMNDAGEDYSDANATGIWYLPARDEMFALYDAYNNYGKLNFNNKLTGAGGTAFSDVIYWASMEVISDLGYALRFNTGGTGTSTKDQLHRARCILAF